MKRMQNVVIAALVFICGMGLLIWAAIDAQWVQTVSAEEILNNPSGFKSKSLQIFGEVAPNSVKERGQMMEFDLRWPKEKQAKQVLHVRYAGLTKVNLISGSDVLIEGKIDEQGAGDRK